MGLRPFRLLLLLRASRISVASLIDFPQNVGKQSFKFADKSLSVLRGREPKRHTVSGTSPGRVFGTSPWNIIVAGLLAKLCQCAKAADHGQIIGANSHTELVIRVSGHRLEPAAGLALAIFPSFFSNRTLSSSQPRRCAIDLKSSDNFVVLVLGFFELLLRFAIINRDPC